MALRYADPQLELAPHRVEPLSRRLWDLDWNAHFPLHVDDVTIDYADDEAAWSFIRSQYPALFGSSQGRFFQESLTDAKRRFWRETDVFLFHTGTHNVGLTIAHPTDWATY